MDDTSSVRGRPLNYVKALSFLLALTSIACVQALSQADIDSIHDAQQLDLMIYNKAPNTPSGQLARAAYCANKAVLDRNDAGTCTDGSCPFVANNITCGAK